MKRKNVQGCNCCGGPPYCLECANVSAGIKFTVTSDCGTCVATLNFKRYTVATSSYNETTDQITLTYSVSDFDDLGGITFTPGGSVIIDGVSYVIVSHTFPNLVLTSATDPGSLVGEEITVSPDHRDFREIDCEAKVRMFIGRKESDPVIITQSVALGDPLNDGLTCSGLWRQDIDCYTTPGPFVCASFPPVGPTTTPTHFNTSDVFITHRFTTVTLTFANIILSGSTIDIEIEVIRYGFDTVQVCAVDWTLNTIVDRACVVVTCPPDEVYEPSSWFAAQVQDRTVYDWVQTTACTGAPLAYHRTFVVPDGMRNPIIWGPVKGCTLPTNVIDGYPDTVNPILLGGSGCGVTVASVGTGKITALSDSEPTIPKVLKGGVVRSKVAVVDWCEDRTQTVTLSSTDDDLAASYFDASIQNHENAFSKQVVICTNGYVRACNLVNHTMWTNYGTAPGFSSGCPCAGTTTGVPNKWVDIDHYWLVEGNPAGTTLVDVDWCEVTSVEVEMVAIP
jgi:hypothetical protein